MDILYVLLWVIVIMFMPLVSGQNSYIESDIQIGITRFQLGIDRETAPLSAIRHSVIQKVLQSTEHRGRFSCHIAFTF